jgi:hypothetical protein
MGGGYGCLFYPTALYTYAERGCESMLKALIVAGADMEITSVSGVIMLATNDNSLLLNLRVKTGILPLRQLPEKVMKLV